MEFNKLKEIEKDPYSALGVSSKKEGVHEATKNLSKGLFLGTFCKILPLIGNLPQEVKDNYVQILHSDGVGTKSNIAYIARKEGYSTNTFQTLPQDALVMNLDDLACVGAFDNFYISNHIARNSNRISNEDITTIIQGYQDFFQKASDLGINIFDAGGETADVGSYTTTLGIDVTASTIIEKNKIIDCDNIPTNGYIVGLASNGQSSYENQPNSGIRSNGLTLAINSLLNSYYRKYPETMDQTVDQNKLFTGPYRLNDVIQDTNTGEKFTISEAILSPTRTYLPILKMCQEYGIEICGIIHCTGGGLTKSIKFGKQIRYVKSNLPATPIIFSEIQEARNIKDKYMYQTFNMGVGLEIIVPNEKEAELLIKIANYFDVSAKIIGYTEIAKHNTNEVIIEKNGIPLEYKL
ncbi:MAG: AIR synthase-related protein [Bacilli bacterium]|nr:AIR synthase-related protein [Bacilli bacterium]